MSQCVVIFSPSGRVHYQLNNKITPFNDLIYSIVNDTYTTLEGNFFSIKTNLKKFYTYKKDELYSAIYFDIVTTIDHDKIKLTLLDILKTYVKLVENDEQEKISRLVDYQFNQLMQLKQSVTPTLPGTPDISAANSGTSSPRKALNTKKKMRKWDNGIMVEDNNDGTQLDYSEGKDSSVGASSNKNILQIDDSAFSKQNDLVLVNELNDLLDDEEEDEDGGDAESKGGFFSKISSYFGSTVEFDELAKKFKDQLISKNIHPATATLILDRLKTKLGAKTTVGKFEESLTEELTKILTPNVSTDLLYQIKNRPKNSRPYVISVVGVNGVGKSTNLAKLAYWFLQNNLNVLICACDTFRSGAVEQLKVHVNNLKSLNNATSKIDIFEKGYGGGDHVVATAKLAIQHAQESGYDIVLIDTAGRTHSNAKLMTPLKKFGDAANPDKIIMVGEALVGTDSVEQAINFNNAFGNKRDLSFFIISKVDTVGDLVGTMINMVVATKVPILFMGTGQTYTDIKRLNVKRVVDMLTS